MPPRRKKELARMLRAPALVKQLNIEHTCVLDGGREVLDTSSLPDNALPVKAKQRNKPCRCKNYTNDGANWRNQDKPKRFALDIGNIGKNISLELTLQFYGVKPNPMTLDRIGGVNG